jgi:hypothetical protein
MLLWSRPQPAKPPDKSLQVKANQEQATGRQTRRHVPLTGHIRR